MNDDYDSGQDQWRASLGVTISTDSIMNEVGQSQDGKRGWETRVEYKLLVVIPRLFQRIIKRPFAPSVKIIT
jgi:hypothetical protein